MQTGQRVYKDCGECLGSGTMYKRPNFAYPETYPSENSVPVECCKCDGVGIIPWGWLRGEEEETMPGEES